MHVDHRGSIKVVELTRECQYCWDHPVQGRVRCGRLAYYAGILRLNGSAGTTMQVYFRCPEHHQQPVNIGVAVGPLGNVLSDSVIENFKVSGLGYKP